MNVRNELKDLFWRLEYPISGDKIKEDDVTKDDVISFVMDYTSKDMQIVISNVDDYVDKLEAERDRFRKALEDILSYTEEGETVDMLIGLMRDIAEQALEGDEE